MMVLFSERKKIYFGKLIKYIMALLIIMIFMFPVLNKRVNDTINYKNNYSYERIYIWKSSYEMGKDNFFTGIGLANGRFKELYDNKYQMKESKEKHINHPHNGFLHSHNGFLHFFVKSGIWGLIGFVFLELMQFIYFYKNFKLSNNNHLRILSLLGLWFFSVFLVGSLFDSYFYFISIQKVYWAMLGFIIACIEVSKFEFLNSEKNKEDF